ncbi:hypothetical protein AB0K60_29440 [Thermopolyspora sp. NPDC052614]|uniref:hypothetical protein n=1 Tax=Thermopolyspora sp. NPDC052614 TaxID=3155682 RepID=UPI003415A8EE
MDTEFRYEIMKGRSADLYEEAAEYRRAREAQAARKEHHRDGRWRLRAVFGKRRTS